MFIYLLRFCVSTCVHIPPLAQAISVVENMISYSPQMMLCLEIDKK